MRLNKMSNLEVRKLRSQSSSVASVSLRLSHGSCKDQHTANACRHHVHLQSRCGADSLHGDIEQSVAQVVVHPVPMTRMRIVRSSAS